MSKIIKNVCRNVILVRVVDMSSELFSAILITYNHKKYIRKAIDSVLAQKTKFDFKIYIYDDASNDGSSDIIREYAKKYPGKIIPNIRSKNSGGLENVFDAISHVSSKYFALLETDDYWCDENKIQMQVNIMEHNLECSFCGHNVLKINFVDGKREPLYNHKSGIITYSKKFNMNDYIKVPINSRVIRTSCINFDNLKNKSVITWDSCQWWYLFDKGSLYYIDKVMSVYNYTSEGLYSGATQKQKDLMALRCIYNVNNELDFKYNKHLYKIFCRVAKQKNSFFKRIVLKYSKSKKILDNFYLKIIQAKEMDSEI